MGRIDKNLLNGEEVVYRTRPHWIVCAKPAAVVLFFCLPPFGLVYGNPHTTVAVLLKLALTSVFFLAIAVAVPLLLRLTVDCAVTNKRVILKTGLINARTVEMFFNKVESVEVKRPLLGRLLNYGTITVHGAGGTPEPFRRIANALQFQREVQERISTSNEQMMSAAAH